MTFHNFTLVKFGFSRNIIFFRFIDAKYWNVVFLAYFERVCCLRFAENLPRES